MSEVLHLYQCMAHGKPVHEFEEVFAVENKGFKDCLHGQIGSLRQILMMEQETLEEFGIAPGRSKESITTYGIALGTELIGQRLRVGEAVLEVTEPGTTCHLLDEIREGLQADIEGRRGLFCRVVKSGRIRRGDRIEIEENARDAS